MAVPRWRAAQNETVRLRIRFEEDGAVYDPFLITKVEILNPSGTVVETALAGWVHESTGVYYLDYAVAAGAPLGAWTDRWTYLPFTGYPPYQASLTFAVFAEGAFDAGDGFLSAAEIRARYLPGTTLVDADLEFASRVCSTFFENGAGRSIRPRTRTLVVDGSGRMDQPLPSDANVSAIVSATDLDTSEVLDVAAFRVRGNRIFHRDWTSRLRRREDYVPSHLLCGGSVFPRGIMNLSIVVEDAGRPELVELASHAVGLMVKAMCADDTVTASFVSNYATEGVDGLDVTYRDMDPGSRRKSLTGIPEVDAIINQCRRGYGRVRSLSR